MILSLLLPKIFEARSLVEFVCDPAELTTQRGILGSPETLLAVARQLEPTKSFQDSYADEKVLQKLRDAVRLEPVPNTSLVRITVSDERAERAAQLANALPFGYESRKYEMAKEDRDLKRRALEDLIAEQEMTLGKLDATTAVVAEADSFNTTITSNGGVNFAFRPERLTVSPLALQEEVAPATQTAMSSKLESNPNVQWQPTASEQEAERVLAAAKLTLVKFMAEPISQDAVIRLHERATANHTAVPTAAVRQMQGWALGLSLLGAASLWMGRGRPRWWRGGVHIELITTASTEAF